MDVIVLKKTTLTFYLPEKTYKQAKIYAVNNGADYSEFEVEITKDIDLGNRNWTPIGDTRDNAFSGTIYGNDKKISGLSNTGYVGGATFTSNMGTSGTTYAFIAYAKGNVTVENLNLDINISGKKTNLVGAAGLIGNYYNKTLLVDVPSFTVKISNCIISGSISGNDKVAGFIGSCYISGLSENRTPVTFTFNNCINYANVSYASPTNALGFRAGGFIGTFEA